VAPGSVTQIVRFLGHGDNVKCFFCDGGLRNREPGDDPWQEHYIKIQTDVVLVFLVHVWSLLILSMCFQRCEYLLQSRGREYVSNVQQSYFNMNERVVSNNDAPNTQFTLAEVLGGQNSVAAAMLSPVVQVVLQMGFQDSLAESLVQSHYLLTGSHYTSVSDLVTDVLQAEEEERQTGEPRPGVELRSDLSPEDQLRQLQEKRTCKVCMDKLVSMVFIPCGHLDVCMDCAASLRHCPICSAVIRGSVRAFMS
uniref:RING-type E3 ubiquitin transferase n=1 Tax=Sinocyclocheilus rhinocerous TaxID=307959 RepID=A0A673K0A0_9TELE